MDDVGTDLLEAPRKLVIEERLDQLLAGGELSESRGGRASVVEIEDVHVMARSPEERNVELDGGVLARGCVAEPPMDLQDPREGRGCRVPAVVI